MHTMHTINGDLTVSKDSFFRPFLPIKSQRREHSSNF